MFGFNKDKKQETNRSMEAVSQRVTNLAKKVEENHYDITELVRQICDMQENITSLRNVVNQLQDRQIEFRKGLRYLATPPLSHEEIKALEKDD